MMVQRSDRPASGPPRSSWTWLLLLVPALVTFGTFSESALAPLGWLGALGVLLFLLVMVHGTPGRGRLRH